MKRIIALTISIVMLFTNFCFALDLNSTANYLEKQNLDEWGIVALYSNGKDVSKKSLKSINSKVTTEYEAYILGVRSQGKDVSSYADIIRKAQRSDGKFGDNIDGTGEDLINAHIWGVISLYSAGNENYDKTKALNWLKVHQNTDGGFSVFVGGKTSDIDLTAMGMVAYSILGLNSNSPEVKKGFKFIEKNIEKKESCESIAWYILSRVKLGLSVDKKWADKLSEYKLKDGSFKHLKSGKRGNYIATYQALLALSDLNKKNSIFDILHNLGSNNKFKDLKQSDYANKYATRAQCCEVRYKLSK